MEKAAEVHRKAIIPLQVKLLPENILLGTSFEDAKKRAEESLKKQLEETL